MSYFEGLTNEEKISLEKILLDEKAKFVPHNMCVLTTSPSFWKTVFFQFYGIEPKDDCDPRWNILLTSGYILLRTFNRS